MDEKRLEELLRKNSLSEPSPASERVVDRVTLRLAQRRKRKNWIQLTLLASAACALITGLAIYLNSNPLLNDDQKSFSPSLTKKEEAQKPPGKPLPQPKKFNQEKDPSLDPANVFVAFLTSENPTEFNRDYFKVNFLKGEQDLKTLLNTRLKKHELSLALLNIAQLNDQDLHRELVHLATSSQQASLSREILHALLLDASPSSLAHSSQILENTNLVRKLLKSSRTQGNSTQKELLKKYLTNPEIRSESIRAYALLSLTKASPRRTEELFFSGLQGSLITTQVESDSLRQLLIETQRFDSKALAKFLSSISRKQNRKSLANRGFTKGQRKLFLNTLAQVRPKGTWEFFKNQIHQFGPQPEYLESLALLGDSRSIQLLRPWLERPDTTGKLCIETIGKIPTQEAVELLVQIFTRWHQFQRLQQRNHNQYQLHQKTQHLAQVLNERKTEVFELLETQLKKKPNDSKTIVSLLSLFPLEAPQKLAQRVGNFPLRTQATIIREFQILNNHSALESLVQLLADPNVKRLARNALISLAREDFGSTPEAWKPWLSQQKERDNNRASDKSSIELFAQIHPTPLVSHPQ